MQLQTTNSEHLLSFIVQADRDFWLKSIFKVYSSPTSQLFYRFCQFFQSSYKVKFGHRFFGHLIYPHYLLSQTVQLIKFLK